MAAGDGWVTAYHPGIDQSTSVQASAMATMRASGWVTMEEHLEMQAHLAKQASEEQKAGPAERDPDVSAAAGKAASGKEK